MGILRGEGGDSEEGYFREKKGFCGRRIWEKENFGNRGLYKLYEKRISRN